MMRLWIILICLHQGYSLISMTTRQLGDPVTFTCLVTDWEYTNSRVKWYRQSIGDTLTLITTLMKATESPTFEQEFSPSRFRANYTKVMSTLTILTTIPEDEALYHCAVSNWRNDQWTGTYLSLKENTQGTSKYTVVQWPTVSNPVEPGDSVTLHCSVLSGSERRSCPGEHGVHWFGVRPEKHLENIIYSNGKTPHECETKPEAPSPSKSCVYRLSKNVTSSDAGTYYCALATCGEIIFGNGTKLDIKETSFRSGVSRRDNIFLLLQCVVLATAVILIAFLIYTIKKNKCDCCSAAVSLRENVAKRNLMGDADMRTYSVVVFRIQSGSGGRRDAKAVKRERIYAAVQAFGVD